MQGIFNVHIDIFEGPLELLYYLIEKNKIDIYDIPIAEITDQYLEHMNVLQSMNMDSMSEFMLMAATLLEIKSKMLLPVINKPEEQVEDPREELVNKLIEYKKFKAITLIFKEMANHSMHVYRSPNIALIKSLSRKPNEGVDILRDVTLERLLHVFEESIKRRESRTDKVRAGFGTVEKDLYTVEEKISYIRDLIILHKTVSFYEILTGSRQERITTFMALLELMKTGEILVFQESAFEDIAICASAEATNGDVM